VDPDYGIAYENLYRLHWWWRAREEVITRTLARFRPPNGWDGILDVGCGDGLSFDWLGRFGKVIHGVEIDPRLVRQEGPLRDRIHLGPFDDTYEPPMAFSLITMLDVVEHMEDPAGALRRAGSVARPGGDLLITVPAFRALWTAHDELNHHYVRYTKQSLRTLVESVGVRVLHDEYFFHWVAPAKLITRFKEQLVGPSASVIPTVPAGWINHSLIALSRAERLLPDWLRPPFGSSLLMMGRFPE